MKKMILFTLMFLLLITSVFSKDKNKGDTKIKKETESIEKIEESNPNTLKNTISDSVLEFIKDVKMNPDTCYIPFK